MADESTSLRVRATRMVFYNGMRIRAGKTFTLSDPAHFSASSMERVDAVAVVDETARAVEASPVRRTETGSTQKVPPRKGGKPTAPVDADPGI